MEEELARRMAAWWRERLGEPHDPEDFLIEIDGTVYDLLYCAMEVLQTPLEK